MGNAHLAAFEFARADLDEQPCRQAVCQQGADRQADDRGGAGLAEGGAGKHFRLEPAVGVVHQRPDRNAPGSRIDHGACLFDARGKILIGKRFDGEIHRRPRPGQGSGLFRQIDIEPEMAQVGQDEQRRGRIRTDLRPRIGLALDHDAAEGRAQDQALAFDRAARRGEVGEPQAGTIGLGVGGAGIGLGGFQIAACQHFAFEQRLRPRQCLLLQRGVGLRLAQVGNGLAEIRRVEDRQRRSGDDRVAGGCLQSQDAPGERRKNPRRAVFGQGQAGVHRIAGGQRRQADRCQFEKSQLRGILFQTYPVGRRPGLALLLRGRRYGMFDAPGGESSHAEQEGEDERGETLDAGARAPAGSRLGHGSSWRFIAAAQAARALAASSSALTVSVSTA